jgi:hypothetical protein
MIRSASIQVRLRPNAAHGELRHAADNPSTGPVVVLGISEAAAE